MSAATPTFVLEEYRGFLLLLARSQWNDLLRGWGDPSDLVQQTLLEAHQKLDKFRGRTAPAFAAWLRSILAHNLLDAGRSLGRGKRDRSITKSLDAALEESTARLGVCLTSEDPTPSSLASVTERLTLLADALSQLPADQQEAVTLHHLRGLSLEAAAAEMRKTKPAVAGLIRRGVNQLGNLLAAGGGS